MTEHTHYLLSDMQLAIYVKGTYMSIEELTEEEASVVIQKYIDTHAVKGYCRT